MVNQKFNFFLKFTYKFNTFYKLKLITLFLISFVIYYFFILSISIEIDTSYFWKKNLYLSLSTPYIFTPEKVNEEDINELNISLKKQIFDSTNINRLSIFKSYLKNNNYIFFPALVSSGIIFLDNDNTRPVFIYAIDFENIKYFEGLNTNFSNINKIDENDCIVSEQLRNHVNSKKLIGSITINGDYNMAMVNIKDFITFKLESIKNLYYPIIYITKSMGEKLFGVNDINESTLYIYSKNSYPYWKDKANIKRLANSANIKGNLFTADMVSKETKITFKYIDLALLFLIILLSLILALLYILINYLSLKDRFPIIGMFKSYGMKDKDLFILFFIEIIVFNIISFIFSMILYVLTIKYIFNYHFSLGNLISTQLTLHISLFYYILPILIIQTFISCYALFVKVRKTDIIHILTGGN